MMRSTPFRSTDTLKGPKSFGNWGGRGKAGAAAESMQVPPPPGSTKGISTSTAGGSWCFTEGRQRSLLSFQLFCSNNNNKIQKQAWENLLSTQTRSKVFQLPHPSSLHTLPQEFPKFRKKKAKSAKGTFFSSNQTPALAKLYNTSLYWENAALFLSACPLYSQREAWIKPYML